MSKVLRPPQHITGHIGDESLQAISCTGTDNTKQHMAMKAAQACYDTMCIPSKLSINMHRKTPALTDSRTTVNEMHTTHTYAKESLLHLTTSRPTGICVRTYCTVYTLQ